MEFVCFRYISLSRPFTEIQQFSYFFDLYSASTSHIFLPYLQIGQESFFFLNVSFSMLSFPSSMCLYIFLLRTFGNNSDILELLIFIIKPLHPCLLFGSAQVLRLCLVLRCHWSEWHLAPSLTLSLLYLQFCLLTSALLL